MQTKAVVLRHAKKPCTSKATQAKQQG